MFLIAQNRRFIKMIVKICVNLVSIMKSAAIALMLLPAALSAQEGAGGNGSGQATGLLTLSVIGAELSLVLNVPSAEIVGFADAAENDDDRAQVATAMSQLSEPLEIFSPPPEAGCMTSSANVTLSGEAFAQNTTGASDRRSRTSFRAEYMVQCQSIDDLNSISFTYFQRFEHAQSLTVRVDSNDASQIHEVNRASPLLGLSLSR